MTVKFRADQWLGMLVLILGISVICGWWLHIPALITIVPGFVPMVFNTALCFALLGAALLCSELPFDQHRIVSVGLSIALIALAGVTLLQYALGVSLGIDQLFFRTWLADANPFPGRPSPQTVTCFVLSGLALLLCYSRWAWAGAIAYGLTLIIGVVAITSLVGYSIQLELLYSWYKYSRMAVHTASGFSVVSVALFLLLYRRGALFRAENQEHIHVYLIGGALLMAIALASGLGSFVILAKPMGVNIQDGLVRELNARHDMFNMILEKSDARIQSLLTRPRLYDYLNNANAEAEGRLPEVDPHTLPPIQQWAGNLLKSGFSSAIIVNRAGVEIARTGQTLTTSRLAIPLDDDTRLLWGAAPVVQIETAVLQNGTRLGTLLTEQVMPELSALLQETDAQTKDFRVCAAQSEADMQCLPSKLSLEAVTHMPRFLQGKPLAMHHALNGENGIFTGSDYRGQTVIGAYRWLPQWKLGMLLKIDADEAYAPIRANLAYVALTTFGIIGLAMLILHWQIAPLIYRVVAARAEAQQHSRRLALSEARFRRALEFAGTGFVLADFDGRLREGNNFLCNMLGYRREELIGMNILDITHPDDKAISVQCLHQVTTGNSNISQFEKRYLHKDGHIVWGQVRVSPLRNPQGDDELIIQIDDITERRRANEKQEQLIAIIEQSPDFIGTADLQGNLLYHNRGARRMVGLPDDADLSTFKIADIHPAWANQLVMEKGIPAVLSTGFWIGDNAVLHRDGREIPVSQVLILHRDAMGEPELLSTIMRDVSERLLAENKLKQYAAELERSNRDLDDFAYVASHDLREPLRGIHSYASFLVEDYGTQLPEEGHAQLATIKRLAQRMEHLIESLLSFSRVGRGELNLRQVDLNSVMNDACETVRTLLNEFAIEIRIPRRLPTVTADAIRVVEIFTNLITNAAKYNDKPQRWIEVGFLSDAESATGELVLYVRDNGIGIAGEYRDTVFQVFKRLHGRNQFGGGSGAGLAIVKKIVERHGGRIWLESEVGQGTTFYFTIQPSIALV